MGDTISSRRGETATVTNPSYANERITEEPARKIRNEIYQDTGYDALWRLSNAGFVIRLENTFIFIDSILTSPLVEYEMVREKFRETDQRAYGKNELKYYDKPENDFKEVHELPLPAEDVEKADYVLLTHEHHDHLDPAGLRLIAHLHPTIVGSKACLQDLQSEKVPLTSFVEAIHGQSYDYGEFTMQIVPAAHQETIGACGYLLETKYGNIYHPGDGNFDHDDKKTVCNLDVDYLLVPINDTNMGVGFAALLTHLIQPKIVIPCHYGYVYPAVRSQGASPAEFVTALAARNYKIPNTDIMILNPGGKVVMA